MRSLFTSPARNHLRFTPHRSVPPSSEIVQSSLATGPASDAFEPTSLIPCIVTCRPGSTTVATPPTALYQPP